MAKRKPKFSSYRKPSIGIIKHPKRPKWMRILYIITMILATVSALLVVTGMVINRLISK